MKEKTKIILSIIFRAINEILRYIITGKKEVENSKKEEQP